ncbi:MAG: hypothetical protein M0Q24_00220 [Sulfurimonas sp.]|uniref:hypothetical protein n=1 Tax=Sulfurimonas sp. TaxID=2022749 RepID=UPI0025EF2799|nr:hypothetical protein [Sulfurimonas sp.]MCK9490484.1 hypothetical protein [Sulfurimonas sp.]
MHPVLDTIMVILFVIFMIFIFGGYHKNKSAQREAEFKRQEEKKDKEINPKESKD